VNELVILVVEDEPEVRAEVVRDLQRFAGTIRVEQADDVADARDAIDEVEQAGDLIGLIVADHRLPGGETGVDLLVSLNQGAATGTIRTILLTGQAGHQDTIRAINDAALDHYFSKPWDPSELAAVATGLLTDYIIDAGIDPLRYARELDGPRLMAAFAERGRPD
jgi:two-component system phosphate regulon response regulator PhoB